jgi:aspartate aminotransferase-like enzyme
MGETSTPANVYHVLSAFEKILPENGYEVPVGAATSAASKVLAKS